jgi:predicted dehydrogenase
MPFTIGMVGAGQFADSFAPLFRRHPLIDEIWVTDLRPERADRLVSLYGLAGTIGSFEDMLADPRIDAIALFTQRWTHGELAVRALRADKHVYSTVPMGIRVEEIGAIIDAVTASGRIYMMGETSFYNPATVLARQRNADGRFGTLFYAEGDYVHDMDLGFYDAYRFSGGDQWKRTASYPPLLYPTHSIGGVLGAWDTHVTKAVGVGIHDGRGDGVFDRTVSMFDNDVSNATALFEVAGGGSFRTNEFRRVGYPSHIRESRFRFFGTEASFEQVATAAFWYTRDGVQDVSAMVETTATLGVGDPQLAHISPDLRPAFVSGYAPVHDRARIPAALATMPNGHEGSHHFLVDDFATAVISGIQPPVNAWRAARFTVPGIIAHKSVRLDGERLDVPDFGSAPES